MQGAVYLVFHIYVLSNGVLTLTLRFINIFCYFQEKLNTIYIHIIDRIRLFWLNLFHRTSWLNAHGQPHFGAFFKEPTVPVPRRSPMLFHPLCYMYCSPLAPLTLAAVPWLRLQEPLAWPLLVIAPLATAALVIVHVLLYHRFKQSPPSSCNPHVHAIPLYKEPPSSSNPTSWWNPRPPLHAMPPPPSPCAAEHTGGAALWRHGCATATDALDGVLIKSILMNFTNSH